MLCAISGEPAEAPVVNSKNGNVYEKRLVVAYINENGRDPITGEELSTDELIELKTSRAVKPRPPTLTSIPSLLAVFQNEWDALALETFRLRQQLTQTRQELSNALYENDAAKRVVARLQKERDEARGALSKVPANGNGSAGDAMQVDGTSLSDRLAAVVDHTQESLSKTRRKRPVPEGWASSETVGSFTPSNPSKAIAPGAKRMALDKQGKMALIGGSSDSVKNYSLAKKALAHSLSIGTQVSSLAWLSGTKSAIGTTTGELKVFQGDSEQVSISSHTGEITGLALHPSGEILASVGSDKTIVLYDVSNSFGQVSKIVTGSALSTAEYHPDGHLFAAGGADGEIKLFETKTGTNVASFKEEAAIQALCFSENGTWLASVCDGSSSVSVWDLRKAAKVHDLDMGGTVTTLSWDYTGQFLAGAGPGGLTIQAYSKAKKEWSSPLSTAVPATAVAWGASASSLVTVNDTGAIVILSA